MYLFIPLVSSNFPISLPATASPTSHSLSRRTSPPLFTSSWLPSKCPHLSKQHQKQRSIPFPQQHFGIKMISIASVLGEAATLGIVVAAVYYVFVRNDDVNAAEKKKSETVTVGRREGTKERAVRSSKEGGLKKKSGKGDEVVGEVPWREEDGLIGFSTIGAERQREAAEIEAERRRELAERSGSKVKLKFGKVERGVNEGRDNDIVSDFMENDSVTDAFADERLARENRKSEELKWAAMQLLDIPNAGGVGVFDNDGNVLALEGDMVKRSAGVRGEGKTPTSSRGIVSEVGREWIPFLEALVEMPFGIMVEDVGEKGAVVVVMARRERCFGDRDLRRVKAAAGRLKYFVEKDEFFQLPQADRELTLKEDY